MLWKISVTNTSLVPTQADGVAKMDPNVAS